MGMVNGELLRRLLNQACIEHREHYWDPSYIKGLEEAIRLVCSLESEDAVAKKVNSIDYDAGLYDAFEALRIIQGMRVDERKRWLGISDEKKLSLSYLVTEYTSAECIRELVYDINEYKKAQAINVGDVVKVSRKSLRGVVVSINEKEASVVLTDGECKSFAVGMLTKTGKHFNEVAAVFTALSSEENEDASEDDTTL